MTMSDDGKVNESDQWCRTTGGETMVTPFTWTIEDFESRPEKVNERMFSSTFLAKKPNGKDSMWRLMLYPKGNKANNHLSIFLQNKNQFQIRANYRVSILNSNLMRSESWEAGIDLYEAMNSPRDALGAKTWTLRETLLKNKDLLPGGHLSIYCEVTIYGTEKTLSGSGRRDHENKGKTITGGSEQVIAQLGSCFNDPEYSDVEVECDEETFHCHQTILSIRSEVFRAMFQLNMKENRTKKVTIKDFDPDVVREMLRFIYTGDTKEDVLKEKSRELLNLAEMYQLDVLKNICEDKLCSTLTISNSIEYLVLGDMHQADKLRRMALRVIARNMTTLVATEEYKDLVKNHPTLVAEIPAAMVDLNTSK